MLLAQVAFLILAGFSIKPVISYTYFQVHLVAKASLYVVAPTVAGRKIWGLEINEIFSMHEGKSLFSIPTTLRPMLYFISTFC